MERKIVFENGREFFGKAFACKDEVIAEVVCNTSTVGYQELLSDPVYFGKIVLMSYPIIGNVGIINDDFESKQIVAGALIIKEYNDKPSNFRYANTLNDSLLENNVVGITHVDTRAITKMISVEGEMKAIICNCDINTKDALKKIKNNSFDKDTNAKVSCKKIWYSRCANPHYNVVAIDLGITYQSMEDINKHKINLNIVPYNTSYEKIMSFKPDGIYLSNGPENFTDKENLIEIINKLYGKIPIFAVGFGNLLLARARGLEIARFKFGHHGCNHPVLDVQNNTVVTLMQNHSYYIKDINQSNLSLTFEDLMNHTVEGFESDVNMAISVQYQPNSLVNPSNADYLINKFIKYIRCNRGELNA